MTYICQPRMLTPGQRWRSAREAAGLSAAEAAELSGASRSTIYDLEKDDEGVTYRMMKQVATVYGITLAAIFADDNQTERVPIEFRPLLEPLMPLTQQAREAVIRNIASNLRFMTQVISPRIEDERHRNVTVEEGSKSPLSDTPSSPVGGGLQTFGLGSVSHERGNAHADPRRSSTPPAPGPFGTQAPPSTPAATYAKKARRVR